MLHRLRFYNTTAGAPVALFLALTLALTLALGSVPALAGAG